MKKKDIEESIRSCFRKTFFGEPKCFSEFVIAIRTAIILADEYWDQRKKSEIERDKSAGVTLADYEKWVKNELLQLKMGQFNN